MTQYNMLGWATFALYGFEDTDEDNQKYYDVKLKLFYIIFELQSGSINLDKQNLRRPWISSTEAAKDQDKRLTNVLG